MAKIVDLHKYKIDKLNKKIAEAKKSYTSKLTNIHEGLPLFVTALRSFDLEAITLLCERYGAEFCLSINSVFTESLFACGLDFDPNGYIDSESEITMFVADCDSIDMCFEELALAIELYYAIREQ